MSARSKAEQRFTSMGALAQTGTPNPFPAWSAAGRWWQQGNDSSAEIRAAHDAIAALVNELALKHPELRLSFGYIGNFERWGDDRDWRIFTNRCGTDGRSVSYYLGGYENLPEALKRATPERLSAWIGLAKTCIERN